MNKRKLHFFTAVLVLCMIWVVSSEVTAGQSGNDIKGHWAEETINRWAGKGIIRGYPDGTFRPDAPVSRAEFAALINRAFVYTALSAVEFADVSDSEWFASEIKKAVAAGYMNGYPDGTFRPSANISRQEAAVVFVRIIDLKDSGDVSFTDDNNIPAWSRPAVMAAAKAGLITGYPDGSFRPYASITRAEVVTVLDRFIAQPLDDMPSDPDVPSDPGIPSDPGGPTEVKVRSIEAIPSELILKVGEKDIIQAIVEPANATNKKVIWSSNNTAVATVDNGEVTAIAPGTAVITARSAENKNIYGSCEVTVIGEHEFNIISNALRLTIEAK